LRFLLVFVSVISVVLFLSRGLFDKVAKRDRFCEISSEIPFPADQEPSSRLDTSSSQRHRIDHAYALTYYDNNRPRVLEILLNESLAVKRAILHFTEPSQITIRI